VGAEERLISVPAVQELLIAEQEEAAQRVPATLRGEPAQRADQGSCSSSGKGEIMYVTKCLKVEPDPDGKRISITVLKDHGMDSITMEVEQIEELWPMIHSALAVAKQRWKEKREATQEVGNAPA
jgi:hypothetical protein